MPSFKGSERNRPFKDLKRLLESRSIILKDGDTFTPSVEPPDNLHPSEDDDQLFKREMSDVTPLRSRSRAVKRLQARTSASHRVSQDAESTLRLQELINNGRGFRVRDTPEYMEGTGPCVHPNMSARLHNGEFAIQAHLDLHGKNADQAETAFGQFMTEARRSGKQGILVIHGRGLSSKEKPVLKEKVREWLTRGPWRKWMAAFSSARLCDGGAGATYILLRNKPLTRRYKKHHR